MNDHDREDDDRAHRFEVRCNACGRERSNLDGWGCSCGSSSESYDSEDARRWNEYSDRRYR